MKPLFLNIALLLGLLGGAKNSAILSGPNVVEFRNARVESNYPDGITFRIEICGRSATSKPVFNYVVSGERSKSLSWTRKVVTVDEGDTTDGCEKRKYHLQTKELYVPPFSPVRYFWSVREGSTVKEKSEQYTYFYRDAAHDWKTLQNPNLAVWWHDRPGSFGEDVMRVATIAYSEQAASYSTSLQAPIVIVITNTKEEFFAWQEHESYAGGMAFPEMYLTIQLVENTSYYYTWLADVIPHEISHIYFNHAVKSYSGASYWLDEGMATYHEYSDHFDEWNAVRDGYDGDHILSLRDLEYGFKGEGKDIDLAYGESYYAVLYMDEVYGKDAIPALLAEYSKGTGGDTAFKTAFGKNRKEFESEFMVWLEKRVETPPPNTTLPSYESNNASGLFLVVMAGLCLSPLCFVAFGAGYIAFLWKLNNWLSVRRKNTAVP
jgi:peptidase MA superfamily protein